MITNASQSTRRLSVKHVTRYQYDRPVQRSTHRLHLRPLDDRTQQVLRYQLTITPPVPVLEYEDVFGNWATRFEITQPYTELVVAAESQVELLDGDPFLFPSLPRRPTFPLVWMPGEQLMLGSYLQPVELPDSQWQVLYDYAVSFAEKNQRDVMETLFAINLTLFREYQNTPGATSLETTPYEFFVHKKGVCQDFANLFICLARLLGIPARYVCGYVYTGNAGENRAPSDASHAWLQVYLPNIGWKGFDPTNGILPQRDHVRVSYGRHYRDTAPTSGTLYTPAAETLVVDVQVLETSVHSPNQKPRTQPPVLENPDASNAQ